jgi:hypothetical protein
MAFQPITGPAFSLRFDPFRAEAISAEWADVIDQVKNAIVAIRVTAAP